MRAPGDDFRNGAGICYICRGWDCGCGCGGARREGVQVARTGSGVEGKLETRDGLGVGGRS